MRDRNMIFIPNRAFIILGIDRIENELGPNVQLSMLRMEERTEEFDYYWPRKAGPLILKE